MHLEGDRKLFFQSHLSAIQHEFQENQSPAYISTPNGCAAMVMPRVAAKQQPSSSEAMLWLVGKTCLCRLVVKQHGFPRFGTVLVHHLFSQAILPKPRYSGIWGVTSA